MTLSRLTHVFSAYSFFFFSFTLKKNYFNWRIITLQYCDGFCHTSIWIGPKYTYIPSILNLPLTSLLTPSSRLSQSTSFGYPESSIKVALVIYFTYGNAYASVLFSRIIPPSASPTESKTLFFTSVSLLLPCMWDHWYHLSWLHIYVLIYGICLSFSDLYTLKKPEFKKTQAPRCPLQHYFQQLGHGSNLDVHLQMNG